MKPPYVIFALPRCRTAWTSRFLAYGGWQCSHDELRHCRSLDDVHSWLALPMTGTVETAAAPFWRLLPRGITVATIRRPIAEVVASLRRGGLLAFDDAILFRRIWLLDRKLQQLAHRLPHVLETTFTELGTEEGCARLFEHCLPHQHDHAWWAHLAPVNMQISVPHAQAYATAHAPQLEKLRRLARHEILRAFRRPAELDGVTFQREPLQQAFTDPDGIRLMAEECVMLGEEPEAWRNMNLSLLARIERMGNLHIFTARSNGRMFGYIVSAIGEAFHSLDQSEADQVSFFADPSWPGLGRKLQHAACQDLRRRGVNRVLMFQPDSTRVGLLYRRLGAKETGQRYVLEL